MKHYKVVLQPEAIEKLEAITQYVAEALQSPLTALNLEIELMEAIVSLEENPDRAPVFSKKLTLTPLENIRKLVVKNYLVLFFIDEKRQLVNIVSIHNHLKEEK